MCQENVLQSMFLCIIPFRGQIDGKKCGLYMGKDGTNLIVQHYIIIIYEINVTCVKSSNNSY